MPGGRSTDVVSDRTAIFVTPETLINLRDSSVVADCASMLGASMEIAWRLRGDVRHKSTRWMFVVAAIDSAPVWTAVALSGPNSREPSVSQDFVGQTALITGSTSGIGRAVAEQLAARAPTSSSAAATRPAATTPLSVLSVGGSETESRDPHMSSISRRWTRHCRSIMASPMGADVRQRLGVVHGPDGFGASSRRRTCGGRLLLLGSHSRPLRAVATCTVRSCLTTTARKVVS